MLAYRDTETDFLKDDPEVKEFGVNLEVTHREYKERGLLPPAEPEIARLYSFKDLEIYLYYEILIG